MTPSVVGFVGLGNMGHPMASRIAAAGFDLVAFDAASMAERLPTGAVAGLDVADVAARADTMLLSVPDGAATAAIVDSVAAAPRRRVTTVVDLSTVGPRAASEAAQVLEPLGVNYVDGPVSGGVAGAPPRTVSQILSGPPTVLDFKPAQLDAY